MPFRNPIVAGLNIIREAIRSPNYVTGVSGWSINKDGTAEFASMIVRGLFRTSTNRILIDDQLIYVFDPSDLTIAAIGMQPSEFWTGDSILGGVIWGYQRIRFAVSPGAPGQVLADTPVLLENGVYLVPDARHFQAIEAAATGTLTKTGADVAFADIPGVTITFTTVNVNALVTVVGIIDGEMSVAGAGLMVGQLLLDGVAEPEQIIMPNVAVTRGTFAQTWVLTVATAAAHTVKLQARKTAAAGTALFRTPHSKISIAVLDMSP